MLKMPEFLKYQEWYIENENTKNSIGNNKNRYTIKNNAPDFIKDSYREYIRDISKDYKTGCYNHWRAELRNFER